MTLLDRMMHLEEPNIPNHQFFSLVGEFTFGHLTQAQAVAKFQADPFRLDQDGRTGELTDLQAWFVGVILPIALPLDRILKIDETHRILLLGESGVYTKAEARTRLSWVGS